MLTEKWTRMGAKEIWISKQLDYKKKVKNKETNEKKRQYVTKCKQNLITDQWWLKIKKNVK